MVSMIPIKITWSPFRRPVSNTPLIVRCSNVQQSLPELPATSPPIVRGPPSYYNHRTQLRQQSLSFIQQHHPELTDLVQSGNLIVFQRPATYVERREDGYKEPELIYILGTSHLSSKSSKDVVRLINTVHPENVVVELCRSRSASLLANNNSDSDTNDSRSIATNNNKYKETNPLNLSGPSLLEAFQRTLALGGQSGLILRLLLGRLTATVTTSKDQSSSQPPVLLGSEFAAAYQAADNIDAQIVLGDRPIEITLRKAWEALNIERKYTLIVDIVGSIIAANKERREGNGGRKAMEARLQEQLKLALEKELNTTCSSSSGGGGSGGGNTNNSTSSSVLDIEDDDVISILFKNFSERYPELVGPLIHERDLYLAWSLKRSKAVNNTKRVVGVVGKGHMRGICYALTHDDAGKGLRFRDLAGKRNGGSGSGKERGWVVKLAAETALFTGLIYIWEHYYHNSGGGSL
jgi:pheromone shutdown protein TraB